MPSQLVPELVRHTLAGAVGEQASLLECETIQQRGKREVFRLLIGLPGGGTLSAFAKVGEDWQVRLEAALFDRLLRLGFEEAPPLIGTGSNGATHCVITQKVDGAPFQYHDRDQVRAVFKGVAHLHAHSRAHMQAVRDLFHGDGDNNPDPISMFDRVRGAWDRIGGLGAVDEADIDLFYDPGVHDLVRSESPTLVHGDLSPENVLISRKDGSVRFIDFGFAAIRAPASEFMYFGKDSSFGELLEVGLRTYWHEAGQQVAWHEFLIRHAYWFASYYADYLSWQIADANLAEDQERRQRRQYGDAITWAAERIRRLRAV